MKIVILDAYPYREKDFAFLSTYGQVTIYDYTESSEVQKRIRDASIVLTDKTILSAADFASASMLRYVGVMATGHDVVDSIAAKKHHITVTNIPAYSTDSVAQHTFALLLELTNHVGAFFADVKKNTCSKIKRFDIVNYPITELRGQTLGIIGFGAIGQRVAQIAQIFGMQVKAYTRNPKIPSTVMFCTLEELFQNSDVISLHCPATAETHQMINASTLKLMKPSALLINVSRGALVDEKALYDALKEGTIAGAGLDVLVEEPPMPTHPLTQLSNCIVTPHVAWASIAAQARILQVTQENLEAYLAGKHKNVIG